MPLSPLNKHGRWALFQNLMHLPNYAECQYEVRQCLLYRFSEKRFGTKTRWGFDLVRELKNGKLKLKMGKKIRKLEEKWIFNKMTANQSASPVKLCSLFNMIYKSNNKKYFN